jgi:hypothetical protein
VRIGGSAAVKILLRLVGESPPFRKLRERMGPHAGLPLGCGNQLQNLVAFGFGNAHPPAKSTREGWGNQQCVDHIWHRSKDPFIRADCDRV